MSETTAQTTELTSHYSAQVAGDLERNVKEQDRLSAEIEALQAQLAALRHDQSVLVNLQQALSVTAPSASAAKPVTAVPAPRKKAAAASATAKQAKSDKPAPAKKRTGKKTATAAPAPQRALPKLVDLVREHLSSQDGPRSAAEVSTLLSQQHPERAVKVTVVRNALEGLVAKNQAQRTKQGTSVFYTAAETSAPTAGEQTPQSNA
ncbi:hypothetical protein ACFW91_31785 [Streptomyces asoensis]|uniref:hypothetical protein n=1 Tax=Streptomyces asoensis TaxID=249586 RepID=UPI003688DD61